MASREEVALAAGVSVRTVSNVVNGFQHVAPTTRARVLQEIERLDYVPSELARSLRRGRSDLVGLMLPELDTPYFAELTLAFVEDGASRGLTVVTDQTSGDLGRELAFLARASQGALFDGLIINPLSASGSQVAAASGGGPVVILGEDDYPGFDKVMIDNRGAAREAVEHLIHLGRRRIAVIGAEEGRHGSSDLRLQGYFDALLAGGLNADDALIGTVSRFSRAEGASAARLLLERAPQFDAVFCFSDPLALGAMRALHQAGIRLPDDVAIVGFDDVEDGAYSTPSLTSVSPDKRWIAATALDRLVGRIEGTIGRPEQLLGPHKLVVRESSLPPAAAVE